MTNKVGIGIEAQLDTSSVEQRINAFGQRVAQANKVQFSPVSVKGLDDLETARKRFEQLLKVQGELNRRVKATGQSGKSPWDMDFASMFPDDNSRARKMRQVMEYTFPEQSASGHPLPSPQAKPAGGGFGSMAGNVAQAGLRAAGPVGGVAAGAIGTGMSAGFGAGLMGLMGGMLALGVGKLVGSVVEKVGEAESNNIALDKLKRNLGDVNVSFDALKKVVHLSSDAMKITYAEGGALASQFVRSGNVRGDQFHSIGEELGVGVGMSRAFGMDPSQGVGVMGQMRGIGVTSNVQDSRRFALLIGETIGKSGAFAKADEVMEAMAGYTVSQTRSNMSAANTGAYAGMFAGMVGSGIPGMDPNGASAMLSRVNAALSAGGAKGEASQFLTARVGQRLGLDPMQTQIFREGGMFATKRESFGEGSAYSRYMGGAMDMGKDADTTHFHARMAELKRDPSYANNPMLLAQAMANDTGLNMRQAMTLMKIEPEKMGEMSKYADVGKLSGNGIGNLSKALYGTSDDRKALAGDYWTRKGDDAISKEDKERLRGAAGDDAKLRSLLAEIAPKYDQEKTVGSDVRDSKAILDNIKTNMADKLVPMVNEMRHGIMYMAGVKDGKSPREIMVEVLQAESKDRQRSIKGDYDDRIATSGKGAAAARAEHQDAIGDLKKDYYKLSPEELAKKQKRVQDASQKLFEEEEAQRKRIITLMGEKETALKKEVEATKKKIEEDTVKANRGTVAVDTPVDPDNPFPVGAGGAVGGSSAVGGGRGNTNPAHVVPRSSGSGRGRSSANAASGDAIASSLDDIKDPTERANVKAMLDGIAHVEGASYKTLVGGGRNNSDIDDLTKHPNKVGLVTRDGKSTAAGRYQITGTTWRGVQKKLDLPDFSPESQDKAAIELLRRRGALDLVKKGDFAGAAEKLGNEWQGLPTGASQNQGRSSWNSFNGAVNRSLDQSKKAQEGTPLPPQAASKPSGSAPGFRVSADDITVRVVDANGQPRQAPQTINTRVSQAVPFGSAMN